MVEAAYGSLSNANQKMIPVNDQWGRPLSTFHTFQNEPYVEMGYGIENIFKIATIGMVHRLNYHQLPNARLWGVNIGLRIHF